MMNSRGSFARIQLSNLKHNVLEMQKRIGAGRFFCPMVKADAYGHGDVGIARGLETISGVSAVGVISVEEAIGLREAGIALPILTFGVPEKNWVEKILHYRLTPVVSQWDQIKEIEEKSRGKRPLRIHLKFNTGMNRLGFLPSEATKLADFAAKSKEVLVEGLCTHFLNGEDADDKNGFSSAQIKQFALVEKAFAQTDAKVHFLNSAAALVGHCLTPENVISNVHGVGGRLGISIYGISPLSRDTDFNLKPILEIVSRIEQLQKVKKGEVVSYGPRWKAERDSVIAVVSVGYADGYFRSLTNKAEMLFRGIRVPTVGTVCMDYTMVDLTDALKGREAFVGEEVIVVGTGRGDSITVSELAKKLDTIPYEILTRIGKRLTRVYVE